MDPPPTITQRFMAHYNDSCENGPLGLLPAQLSYRPGFWRDNTLH